MEHLALKDAHLFSKAYSSADKVKGRYVTLCVMKDKMSGKLARANPEKKKLNRVGISTSKKVGCAVVRSRVRRIIRAAYAEIEKEGIVRGKIIVIIPRPAATEAGVKSGAITEDLRRLFARLGLLTKETDDT